MFRLISIFVVGSIAGLFAWWVPLLRLFDAFQPILVALSIMAAAVFVRLNRGMPTLEWKSADPEKRSRLTEAIVDIAREYCWILIVNFGALSLIVGLIVVGKGCIGVLWSDAIQKTTSGVVGASIAICILRMIYVVWRDYDIIKLQKSLIDSLAHQEASEIQARIASEKLSDIKASGVLKANPNDKKLWGD